MKTSGRDKRDRGNRRGDRDRSVPERARPIAASRQASRSDEAPTEKIYGFRAAIALCERRPDDVLEIAFDEHAQRDLEKLLQWARHEQIRTRGCDARELARLAEAQNHEGIVLTTRARSWLSPRNLAETLVRQKGVALALDRVRNPYNVGAILRTAAYFGAEGVLLGAPAPYPGLTSEAVRVAEGGTEHLAFARTTDLVESLRSFREAGIQVIAGDTEGPGVADRAVFKFARPLILVVGNEREGLSDRVLSVCDARVTIRGAGAVESLNVSIATSILLAEIACADERSRAAARGK